MRRCRSPGPAACLTLLAVPLTAALALADAPREKIPAETVTSLEEFAYSSLRGTRELVFRKQRICLTAKAVRGKTLVALKIEYRDPDGELLLVAHAKEGTLRVDSTRKILVMELKQVSGKGSDNSEFRADKKVQVVQLPRDFGKR
jgi:hypothetical protein